MIVLGIFLAFFGNKMVDIVIFIIGSLATWVAGVWFVFWVLTWFSAETSQTAEWVIIGVVAALALGVGFLLVKFRKVGFGLLAAWGGVFLGFLITTTFLVSTTWAYWTIIVGCAVALFILTIYVEKHVVMCLTSFVGSYGIVRGISLYAGGFPSELEIHRILASGDLSWDNFDKVFYAYIAGILVLSVLSAAYQFKHGGEDKKGHPYHTRV